MRTAQFIFAGILLLGAFMLLGRIFRPEYAAAPRMAKLFFELIWLMLAAFNLWVGIARAGYTLSEELPVFVWIFGGLTACVAALSWL